MVNTPHRDRIRVLFDGWSLVNSPNSPEALHLLLLLEQSHPEVHAAVALPGSPPAWLETGAEILTRPPGGTQISRLAWEQNSLPTFFRQSGANLLHLTGAHPPLLGSVRSILSPAGTGDEATRGGRKRQRNFQERVRTAVSAGGMSRLRGLLWPRDLLAFIPGEIHARVYPMPVEPALTPVMGREKDMLSELELPETYILYHAGAGGASTRRALQAWSWASGAIGEYYPLLILGLDSEQRNEVGSLVNSYHLEGSVQVLPVLPPELILPLYQEATAVFQPNEPSPWGSPLREALRCGKPLVAAESSLTDALVGPGAYLLPLENPRALGAGLVTVIVEESVAEMVSRAGEERAQTWKSDNFREDLYKAYRAVREAG
jgi:hypothetical protein